MARSDANSCPVNVGCWVDKQNCYKRSYSVVHDPLPTSSIVNCEAGVFAHTVGALAQATRTGAILMYQVKELKYLVGETLVAGLNNLGDACGTGDALGAPVGLIWYANGLVKQMANASFTAINDANFVVGIESPGGIVGAETEQLTYTTLGHMMDAT